jgi:hypothetical protein
MVAIASKYTQKTQVAVWFAAARRVDWILYVADTRGDWLACKPSTTCRERVLVFLLTMRSLAYVGFMDCGLVVYQVTIIVQKQLLSIEGFALQHGYSKIAET